MSENGQVYHIIVFSTVLTEVSRRFRTRGPITNGYKCTLVHKVLLKGFSSCVCKAPEPAKHPQFQPVSSSSTASSFFPFKTFRSHSASTCSKNIRRSINLVFVDSCLRIHSQNEARTHRYVLPKCLPKVILLLHLSAICLSSDCRRPRRVPSLQLLEILPHPAHGRFSVHSRRLLNAVTSSTFFATSSPNLVTASCSLSALFFHL